MSSCEMMGEILSAFMDGEATAAESSQARAHLDSCADCRAIVHDWRSISNGIEPEATTKWERIAVRPRNARQWASRLLVAAAFAVVAASGSALIAKVTTSHGGRASTPAVQHGSTRPKPDAGTSKLPTVAPTDPTTDADPIPATATPIASVKDQPLAARGSNGVLVMTIATERRTVGRGETLTTSLTLRNVTDATVSFKSPMESAMDVVVQRDGVEVARRSAIEKWSGTSVTRTLAPGASMVETFSITLESPGSYTLYGECVCRSEIASSPDPVKASSNGSPEIGDGTTVGRAPASGSSPTPQPSETTKSLVVVPFKTGLINVVVTASP